MIPMEKTFNNLLKVNDFNALKNMPINLINKKLSQI